MTKIAQLWDLIETSSFHEDIKDIKGIKDVKDNDDDYNDKEDNNNKKTTTRKTTTRKTIMKTTTMNTEVQIVMSRQFRNFAMFICLPGFAKQHNHLEIMNTCVCLMRSLSKHLFGCFVWMCLPGGKAYQRDPVEECDSSAEKRHYAATPSSGSV